MPFPIDEKYIIKAENELGIRFPDSFRDKMMESNGEGVEVKTDFFFLHPFYDTSNKKRIKRTCNSIVHETSIARKNYELPENLIIIGNNEGGDLLVYKIKENGELSSSVYWLDHETNELNFVTDNFGELSVRE